MLIDDEAMTATNAAPESPSPGRSCPLHYRYAPEVFRAEAPPRLQSLEVLYVVGGLYGNERALERVLELFDRERGRKRLVFNGDFHWFDADPDAFARVQAGVLAHEALRGNVETELASEDGDDEAGCGCAYPDWVGQGVVERSNRILRRLRQAAAAPQRAELAALPMWLRPMSGRCAWGWSTATPPRWPAGASRRSTCATKGTASRWRGGSTAPASMPSPAPTPVCRCSRRSGAGRAPSRAGC